MTKALHLQETCLWIVEHLLCMNICPKKEEGYYDYFLSVEGSYAYYIAKCGLELLITS